MYVLAVFVVLCIFGRILFLCVSRHRSRGSHVANGSSTANDPLPNSYTTQYLVPALASLQTASGLKPVALCLLVQMAVSVASSFLTLFLFSNHSSGAYIVGFVIGVVELVWCVAVPLLHRGLRHSDAIFAIAQALLLIWPIVLVFVDDHQPHHIGGIGSWGLVSLMLNAQRPTPSSFPWGLEIHCWAIVVSMAAGIYQFRDLTFIESEWYLVVDVLLPCVIVMVGLQPKLEAQPSISMSANDLPRDSNATTNGTTFSPPQLQERISRLECENLGLKTKASYVSSLAHEVRTPLNALLACCTLLNDMPLTMDQRELIDLMISCGSQITNNIDYVLEMARLENNKVILDSKPFNAKEMCQAAIDMVRHLAQSKQLELKFLPAKEMPTLLGDSNRIKQALLNLLTNSIKFTEKGAVSVDVTYKIGHEHRPMCHLQITVSDTGIGMTPEQQAKLFQPFVQASEETWGKYGGSGLGLTISQKLIGLMGGRLYIDSERTHVGIGSTFVIDLELPVAYQGGSSPRHSTLRFFRSGSPRARQAAAYRAGPLIPQTTSLAIPGTIPTYESQPPAIIVGLEQLPLRVTPRHQQVRSPPEMSTSQVDPLNAMSEIGFNETISSFARYITPRPVSVAGVLSARSAVSAPPAPNEPDPRLLDACSATKQRPLSSRSASPDASLPNNQTPAQLLPQPSQPHSSRRPSISNIVVFDTAGRLTAPAISPASVPSVPISSSSGTARKHSTSTGSARSRASMASARSQMSKGSSPRLTVDNAFEVERTRMSFHLPKRPGSEEDASMARESYSFHSGHGSSGLIPLPGSPKHLAAPTTSFSNIPTTSTFTPAAQLSHMVALLVEDNNVSNVIMARLLRSMGFGTVLAALDGEDGLQKIKEFQKTIHIIFTDVNLPGMNGVEFTTRVRQHVQEMSPHHSPTAAGHAVGGTVGTGTHHASLPSIRYPIIVGISGASEDETIHACRQGGMDAFLTKPVARSQISQLVIRWFGLTKQPSSNLAGIPPPPPLPPHPPPPDLALTDPGA